MTRGPCGPFSIVLSETGSFKVNNELIYFVAGSIDEGRFLSYIYFNTEKRISVEANKRLSIKMNGEI